MVVFLCALLIAAVASDDDVILKPRASGGEDVAIIGLHGAMTGPSSYVPLLSKVQEGLPGYSLWVGLIGGDIANMPNPVQLDADLSRVEGSLRSAGFNGSTVFYLAHSLGGVILQDYLRSNPKGKALILLGSYLQRKYNLEFPLPTLTVGAELDGLSRVTRIMESYFVYVANVTDKEKAVRNNPITLIRKACHSQFADENVPLINQERDLKPEISFDEAHDRAASVITAFLKVQLGDNSAVSTLQGFVDDAGSFFGPLITAFKLEGFYHFSPPCYDKLDRPKKFCTRGSPWSEQAQAIMGGVADIAYNVTDTFHPVDQINPVHLPVIYNKCQNGTDCKLSLKTVTENVYSKMDGMDTASFSASAWEMRVKMSSRQAVMESVGMKADFKVVDAPDICAQINQASLNWALNNSDPETLARYLKYGERYVMGPDIGPYNMGPLWIWSGMKYNEKQVGDKDVTQIQSIMMKTPTDYWIKASAGFHYCKLLSPAHAIEWIYVDGLRKYRSYNSK